jgi:hypothetical protein
MFKADESKQQGLLMQYFNLTELIAPEIRAVLSESALWNLIPKKTQSSLDLLRELYNGPLYINGRYNGKMYKASGVRPLNSETGAKRSKHKIQGSVMAFDIKCDDFDKLDWIVKHNFQTLHICRMEEPEKTKTWRHLEFDSEKIPEVLKVFNP